MRKIKLSYMTSKRKELELQPPITVGTIESSDLRLYSDLGVSRRHAVLEWNSDETELRLIDLGTMYGSFIANGLHSHDKRVSGSEIVNSGDRLQFGRCPVWVSFDESNSTSIEPDEIDILDTPEMDGYIWNVASTITEEMAGAWPIWVSEFGAVTRRPVVVGFVKWRPVRHCDQTKQGEITSHNLTQRLIDQVDECGGWEYSIMTGQIITWHPGKPSENDILQVWRPAVFNSNPTDRGSGTFSIQPPDEILSIDMDPSIDAQPDSWIRTITMPGIGPNDIMVRRRGIVIKIRSPTFDGRGIRITSVPGRFDPDTLSATLHRGVLTLTAELKADKTAEWVDIDVVELGSDGPESDPMR